MNKLMMIARQFRDDDNGAAMIEYTILLGIVAIGVIGLALAIGAWTKTAWSGLCSDIQTNHGTLGSITCPS